MTVAHRRRESSWVHAIGRLAVHDPFAERLNGLPRFARAVDGRWPHRRGIPNGPAWFPNAFVVHFEVMFHDLNQLLQSAEY